MGLLSQGSLLSWEETQHHVDHIRRHGILQFLHIYHAVKEWHKDVLKWGNEAAQCGSVDCAKILLEGHAYVNHQDIHGFSALHHAARNNDTSFIKLLLHYNANKVEETNKEHTKDFCLRCFSSTCYF